MLIPQHIEFTDDEEALLDQIWDEIRRENEAQAASAAAPKAKTNGRRRTRRTRRQLPGQGDESQQ